MGPFRHSLTPVRYLRRMPLPPDAADAERPDLNAFRTANLADPELVAACEVENEAILLDYGSYGDRELR